MSFTRIAGSMSASQRAVRSSNAGSSLIPGISSRRTS